MDKYNLTVAKTNQLIYEKEVFIEILQNALHIEP